MQDSTDTTDLVEAKLTGYEPPRFPCAECGAETKEHHGGARICSSRTCRLIVDAVT